MSQSSVFKDLEEAGVIKTYNGLRASGEIKKGEETSLGYILSLLNNMDTTSLMLRYTPSVSDMEILSELYGGSDRVSVSKDHPEYIRHITPFMKVTGEGAFFILRGYGWRRGSRGRPEKHQISVVAFHPSPVLMRDVILGKKTLREIQDDPSVPNIQMIDAFDGEPADIHDLKIQLEKAGSSVYETDMNDRLIAEIQESKREGHTEWRNRNIYYYTKPKGRNKQRERLFDVFFISTRGIIENTRFDEKNKWVRRLGPAGLIPRRCVVRNVTLDDASHAVERDFLHIIPHLTHGSDPCFEMKMERDIQALLNDEKLKPSKKDKKMQKLLKKKDSFAHSFQSNFLNMILYSFAKDSKENIGHLSKHVFKRWLTRAAGRSLKVGARATMFAMRNPVVARAAVYSVLAAVGLAKANNKENSSAEMDWGQVWQDNQIMILTTAFLVLFEVKALIDRFGSVKQTPKFNLYNQVSPIGHRMFPEYGRYSIRPEFLDDAIMAFDKEVRFWDLAHPNLDHIDTDIWDQYHLLEDYSPLTLTQGSVVREIHVGKYEGVYAEGPNGFRRIFIPDINTVFQWFEEREKLEEAIPVSEYLSDKFAHENKDAVFMLRNLGVAEREYQDPEDLKLNGLVSERMTREMMQIRLQEIARESLEAKEDPYHQQFRDRPDSEVSLQPKVTMKKAWLRPWAKKPVFDYEGTYPPPVTYAALKTDKDLKL